MKNLSENGVDAIAATYSLLVLESYLNKKIKEHL